MNIIKKISEGKYKKTKKEAKIIYHRNFLDSTSLKKGEEKRV